MGLHDLAQVNPTDSGVKRLQRHRSVLETQVCVTWDKLNYRIRSSQSGQVNEAHILKNLSGSVQPGQLLAIMGPSGCGKTTFLEIMACRGLANGGLLEGEIKVNGKDVDQSFKNVIGYVKQEDHLYGVLTVRETLEYAAFLQLPERMSQKEKLRRVEDVMDEVGLTSVKDVKIGNVFYKGISGGQKRRVSIAIQLLKRPSLLILDEPTSGLDSTAAYYLMKSLRELTATGVAIICTIHQPSSQVFEQFDQLMLLSSGHLVYFGPAQQCSTFFSHAGLAVPGNYNPPDYFLSKINPDFGQDEEEKKSINGDIAMLVKRFKDSHFQYDIESNNSRLISNPSGLIISRSRYGASYLTQIGLLSHRGFVNSYRNPAVFGVRLGLYFGLCLMLGLGYWDLGFQEKRIQDRISCLFYLVAFLCFMSVAVIPAFIEERAVFLTERMNGMYRVSAYAISNTFVACPGLLIITTVSCIVVYPMAQLHMEWSNFWIFYLNLFVSLIVSEAVMVTISAAIPIFMIAIAIGAAMMGFFMLLCGFFLLPENIPDYFIWGHYMAFHKYSFEIFMFNDLDGLKFDPDPQRSGWPANQDGKIEGKTILERFEYENVDTGLNFGVLIAMFFIWRILFYLALRFLHTGKRK